MGLANSRQEAFWEACGFGHLQKAKYLLEAGDIDVNWVSYTNECCPIHTASQGKKEIVELLLQHNCDVNVRDIRGNLPLHHAAMKGHTDIVKMLLDAGSDIDVQEKNGWTALHNAAYWCRPEVVRLLIKHGADVNLQNKDERTALHECARSQQKDDTKLAEIAQMLIDAGSDINAKSSDFGEADLTGLMFATFHNHPEVATVLISAGCELDAIGTTFWTALHWAAEREHDELVYILLDAGANPTKRCLKGETALDRAKSEPIQEILRTAMQLHRELHKVNTMEALPVLKRERTARAEKTYKPICDANFKSKSFLPGDWKPSSSVDVKNLINEKKARLAAMTKQQYRDDLARRTGSNTIITDTQKTEVNNDRTEHTDSVGNVREDENSENTNNDTEESTNETDGSVKSESTDGSLGIDGGVENKDIDQCGVSLGQEDSVAKTEEHNNAQNNMQQKPISGETSPASYGNVKEMIKEKKSRLATMTKQDYRYELAKRTGSKTIITDTERSDTEEDTQSDVTANSNNSLESDVNDKVNDTAGSNNSLNSDTAYKQVTEHDNTDTTAESEITETKISQTANEESDSHTPSSTAEGEHLENSPVANKANTNEQYGTDTIQEPEKVKSDISQTANTDGDSHTNTNIGEKLENPPTDHETGAETVKEKDNEMKSECEKVDCTNMEEDNDKDNPIGASGVPGSKGKDEALDNKDEMEKKE